MGDKDSSLIEADSGLGFSADDISELERQIEASVAKMKLEADWGSVKATPADEFNHSFGEKALEMINDSFEKDIVGLFSVGDNVQIRRPSGEIDQEGWQVVAMYHDDDEDINMYKVSNTTAEPGYVLTVIVKESDLLAYQNMNKSEVEVVESVYPKWLKARELFEPSFWSSRWYTAGFLMRGAPDNQDEYTFDEVKRENRRKYMLGNLALIDNGDVAFDIEDEYKMRIGSRILSGLDDESIDAFQKIIDGDDGYISYWIDSNKPDYRNDDTFNQILKDIEIDNKENVSAEKIYASTAWIETNRPDFREIVAGVAKEMTEEL